MHNEVKKRRTVSKSIFAIMIVSSILLFLAGSFFAVRFSLGEAAQSAYDAGGDITLLENLLLKLNFPAGYVPYYDLGNQAYRRGDYKEAVNDYYNALNHTMPEQKECKVRINLALSMLAQIDYTRLGSPETLQSTIDTLLTARQILIQDGCAHENDENGHNPEAQRLKDEIDELLKQLLSESGGGDSTPPDSEPENDDENRDSDKRPSDNREKRIQDQIRDQKDEAQKERSSEQDSLRDYVGGDEEEEGDGDYTGKTC